MPVCLLQCGSHGVPPPSPSRFTKTQTTSQYPQAGDAEMNAHTHTNTHACARAHTTHQPHIPSKEVHFWKLRMSEVSVFPLFNHPALKGHTEFSSDTEASHRGRGSGCVCVCATSRMSNSLTVYYTVLPGKQG